MSKARTLANFVSSGNPLADGAIAASEVTGLSTVATTGAYADLSGKPTLSTVAATGAYADLSGKPSLAAVATTGSYTDLSNKPTTIGTANDLSGGAVGSIPYQVGTGDTAMLAAGTAGQVLSMNGGGLPTWTTPAPGAGSVTAVATGSLSDGTMVIVNSDGTVSAVTATVNSTPSVGSEYVFKASTSIWEAIAYDSINNKIVIVFQDVANGNYGNAVVGSVSGTTITFGTPVVFNSANTSNTAITFDASSGKVVIAYRNVGGGNAGYAIVGTVSGTNISFGTAVAFKGNYCINIAIAYHVAAQKVVINYSDVDNNNIEGIVGTVSSSSISFGSPVAFAYGVLGYTMRNVYDSANQKIVATWQNGNVGYAQAVVGTVSGTSISFGGVTNVSTNFCSWNGIAFDSANGKIVVTYVDESTSNYGKAVVGTVSGTSISFGSAATFNYATTTYTAAVYDVAAGKIAIAYNNSGSYGTALAGTVSGTSISFSSTANFNPTSPSQYVCIAYDSSNQQNVVAYQDSFNGSYGTACVFQTQTVTTNLTSENYIGVSTASYTNGQTATIQTVGSTDDAQSGLTPGQSYYIQKNGSLGLVPDNPSVFAGTALAATKLIIKG